MCSDYIIRAKIVILSVHLAKEGSLQQVLALAEKREGQGKARMLAVAHQP